MPKYTHLLLTLFLSMPVLTHAAIVIDEQFSSSSRTAFSVLGDDLINTGQATLESPATISSGSFTPLNSNFQLSNINDGNNSNANGSIVDINYDAGGAAVGSLMYSIQFDLDCTTNVYGYDITSIISTSNGGDSRVNQSIEIYYSTVGSEDYTLLTSNSYTPQATNIGGLYSAQVTITEDTTGVLASNVDSLIISALKANLPDDPSFANSTVFAEFDAVGAASSIPEPTTWAGMVGLAAFIICHRYRRVRS